MGCVRGNRKTAELVNNAQSATLMQTHPKPHGRSPQSCGKCTRTQSSSAEQGGGKGRETWGSKPRVGRVLRAGWSERRENLADWRSNGISSDDSFLVLPAT